MFRAKALRLLRLGALVCALFLSLAPAAADHVTLDTYATGIAGKSVGTAGHVGAGVRVSF